MKSVVGGGGGIPINQANSSHYPFDWRRKDWLVLGGSLLEIISYVLITHFLKAPSAIRGTQVVPYSKRQLMTNRRLLYIATYSCSSIVILLFYAPWQYTYLSLPLMDSMTGSRDIISCGDEFFIVKEGK